MIVFVNCSDKVTVRSAGTRDVCRTAGLRAGPMRHYRTLERGQRVSEPREALWIYPGGSVKGGREQRGGFFGREFVVDPVDR